jgi:Fe-S cluster biogenesis protein NfuA/nitrite reductase/ring-hydroxylating ferredoxin subunit
MNAIVPPPTERNDLAGLLGDLERLEAILAGWDQDQQQIVGGYRRAIDALHAEALKRLIRSLKNEPAALAALKQAATDEVVHAVLRYHEVIRPSVNERVEAALAGIRPLLAAHGGDVELLDVDPPTVRVRLTGACDGCASSALTFQAGIRKAVREACPEITEILQITGAVARKAVRFASPFGAAAASDWLPVCAIGEIPDGGVRAAEIGGEKVALFRRAAAVTCFQDECAHLGQPIHGGAIVDGVVTCPHHGFRYDVASGECLTAPALRLRAHTVRVVRGHIEVRLAR